MTHPSPFYCGVTWWTDRATGQPMSAVSLRLPAWRTVARVLSRPFLCRPLLP